MPLNSEDVALAYRDFLLGQSTRLVDLMADDFIDHVSGKTGTEIWQIVSRWLDDSFAERAVEVHGHATTADGRTMVWITLHATHIGSGFPWMRGRPASGRRVAWSQLHVFKEYNETIVEHWAVRDDLRVLEAIDEERP
jgi:SnoaL-like polyketide cyclase